MKEHRQSGLTTIQFVTSVALALAFFTLVANLLVVQYARGVVRSALEEAVRAGSRAGAGTTECTAAGRLALEQLLGGALGEGIVLSCVVEDGLVTAAVEGTLPSWFPGVPDFGVEAAADAVKEEA